MLVPVQEIGRQIGDAFCLNDRSDPFEFLIYLLMTILKLRNVLLKCNDSYFF